MATTNKDFRVKNGLIVEGANATVNGNEVLTNAASVNALSDVTISSPTSGQVLKWNGAAWINDTDATGAGGAGNSFTTVSANGTSVVADSSTDTLTITPGTGISIVGNATSDTITFSVNGGLVPSGGTAGQILSKSDETDYNTVWINEAPAASYTSVVKHKVKLGEAIAKGQAVYVSSASGSNMIVSKASNLTEPYSSKTMGLLETGGSTNAQVNVITEGILTGIDVGAASAGDPIWLGESGNLIYGLGNKPIAPKHLVFIGIVTKEGNNGEVFVRPQNGFELNEIHNVLIGSNYASVPADNNLLVYDYANVLWTNQTAEQAGIANLAGATFTGNVAGTNLSLSGNFKFSNIGTGAPTFTTYSSGVRTVFYDNINGSSVGYSRGIDAGVLWDSLPAADGGMYFKWYGGQTQVASLSGTGTFATTNVNATNVTATTLIGNTNASTIATGTIPSGILGNSTVYVGTTAVALNRTTASQTLTGVSIDGSAGTVTNGVYTTTTSLPNVTSINSTTIPNAATLLTTSNIGGSVQAYDADLTSIAGLANASGYLYNNGTGTFSYATPTSTTYTLAAGGTTSPTITLTPSSGSANTITFATSGTGISFGQTGGTITITSNASDANGASTIVSRNATGNFNANTITVTTLIGNTNAATITGTVANGTTTTAASGVGYMGIPQNLKSASYTLAAEDAGKHIYVNTSGVTITIPSNANVAFPVGTAITIIATANTVSVAYQAGVTIYQAGVGLIASSPMTVGLYGMGTLLKVATDTWYISGVGVAD